MTRKKTFSSDLATLAMMALTLLFGACSGGGGRGGASVVPSAPSASLVSVETELGVVSVDISACADIDLKAVAQHFNRDLDRPCQEQMGIRDLDVSGLVLECARDHQYIGQYFPPQHIVFAREQALRHERDHWAARQLDVSCWAEIDHTVDFCCQPI